MQGKKTSFALKPSKRIFDEETVVCYPTCPGNGFRLPHSKRKQCWDGRFESGWISRVIQKPHLDSSDTDSLCFSCRTVQVHMGKTTKTQQFLMAPAAIFIPTWGRKKVKCVHVCLCVWHCAACDKVMAGPQATLGFV